MRPFLALQQAQSATNLEPAILLEYAWLALAGLVGVFVLFAFVYLLARRHEARLVALLEHELTVGVDAWLSRRMPGLWRFIRRRITISQWHGLALTVAVLVLFGLLAAFAAIADSWASEATLYRIDRGVNEALRVAFGPRTIRAMQVLTHYGDFVTVATISLFIGIFLYRNGHRRRILTLVLVTPVGGLVLWGLKFLFGRARPEAQNLTWAVGESFPSGHAFISAAFYGYLIILTWRIVRNDAARLAVTLLLSLIIVIVGMSRIILSVHWVSDVMGGIVIGLAWLVTSIVLTRAVWR